MQEDFDSRLKGAGRPKELRKKAAALSGSGHEGELLPQLAQERLRLLSHLREADERLACLDRAIADIQRKRDSHDR